MPWFFFDDWSLSWCLEGVEEAEEEELVIWESSNLSEYLVGFFLSDLMGELNREVLGELDPSGLEESDFLEEKNRPLNTIFEV